MAQTNSNEFGWNLAIKEYNVASRTSHQIILGKLGLIFRLVQEEEGHTHILYRDATTNSGGAESRGTPVSTQDSDPEALASSYIPTGVAERVMSIYHHQP